MADADPQLSTSGYCSAPGQSWTRDVLCGTTIAAAETWRSLFSEGGETARTVSGDAAETAQTVGPYAAGLAGVGIGLGTVGLPVAIGAAVVGVGLADQVFFRGAGRKVLTRAII